MQSAANLSGLALPAPVVAKRILGSFLVRELSHGANTVQAICRIVETEAYLQTDAASHSHRGMTPRTAIMFGPPGFLYVYFTYGMHYCCNIVTGPVGSGDAVLIRAVEPVGEVDERIMSSNRGGKIGKDIANGPAKLCQALGIDKTLNGHDVSQLPFQLQLQPAIADEAIVTTTRIGIVRDTHQPWRYYIQGNPCVSKL